MTIKLKKQKEKKPFIDRKLIKKIKKLNLKCVKCKKQGATAFKNAKPYCVNCFYRGERRFKKK